MTASDRELLRRRFDICYEPAPLRRRPPKNTGRFVSTAGWIYIALAVLAIVAGAARAFG